MRYLLLACSLFFLLTPAFFNIGHRVTKMEESRWKCPYCGATNYDRHKKCRWHLCPGRNLEY